MTAAFKMTAPPEVYRGRRARLGQQLARPILLQAGVAPPRTYVGNPHPFRACSHYLYYGGPAVEGAGLLLEPQNDGTSGCFLLRILEGPDDALWSGAPPTDAMLAQAAGLPDSAVADRGLLAQILGKRQLSTVAPANPGDGGWLQEADVRPAEEGEKLAIIEARLIKDDHELRAMREAARVTVLAHQAAMSATRAGTHESHVAAAFYATLMANNCRPSFTPIVTARGEILHRIGYHERLEDGALLLVDGGAEERSGYACDVTRTWPVSGEWSATQREIYDAVLKAMRRAAAACVSGTRYREVHDLAAEAICEGLAAVDLLKGDPAELAHRRAHVLFFPHGVGHLIGLDVHDMEDLGDLAGYAPGRKRRPGFGDRYLRLDRDLRPGMCVTIEPGVYIVPAVWQSREIAGPFEDVVNHKAVRTLLQENFGGIRIEDTITVTSSGPVSLTGDLATDPDSLVPLIGLAG